MSTSGSSDIERIHGALRQIQPSVTTMGVIWESHILVRIAILCLSSLAVTAQPGFLSIDCGSVVNYTDPLTGIEWVTDEGYIQTGVNTGTPTKKSKSIANGTQLWDHRSFPDNRKKNCYILPAEPNSTYLFRSTFLYLNARQLLSDLSFDIYINSTLWTSVTYGSSPGSGGPNLDTPRVFEALLVSHGSELVVCLVRKQGTPFISSLELRKLAPGMYEKPITGLREGKILLLEFRWNFGATQEPGFRFPDDPYDRWWHPDTEYPSPFCPAIINSSIPLPPSLNDNRIPVKVMEDACTAYNESMTLKIGFSRTVQIYFGVLYFQEIDINASESNQRAIRFDVRNNPEPFYLNVTNAVNDDAASSFNLSDSRFEVILSKAPWSQLDPLVNAGEFYLTNDVISSTTNQNDSKALKRVLAGFNLLGYTGDPCFPVPWEWLVCDNKLTESRVTKLVLSYFHLEGFLDPAIAELTALTDLLVDSNNLTGPIPNLQQLTKLQRLHLQSNSFDGNFPNTLFQLQSLQELNLTSNNLTGRITACPGPNLYSIECADNPLLPCSSSLKVCKQSGTSGSNGAKLTGGVISGFVLLSIFLALLLFILIRKRRQAKAARKSVFMPSRFISRSTPHLNLSGEQKNNAAKFTFNEVQKMTKNLEEKIGRGSYGAVYLGQLPTGKKVAVKVHDSTSGQGRAEFVNEVSLLSRVHHKNLVSLLGYCEESDEQILIYDYMGKGTLREHLYGDNVEPLDWKTRLDIAINSGKGLEYLHKDCHPQIIHRDVKSSNILLDENLVAKVADFGLSKAGPDGGINSGISTLVKGTPGYFDPEYFMTQRLTHKSDVYSFGIVLLEIISGLPPYHSQLPDGSRGTLLEWVKKQSPENILRIADRNLEDRFSKEAMQKVIDLAFSCIELQSVNRPDMEHVVRVLCDAYYLEFPVDFIRTSSFPTQNFSYAIFSDSSHASSVLEQMSHESLTHDSPSMGASYKVGR